MAACAIAALGLTLSSPAEAQSEEVLAQCVSSHEQSQVLQQAGKLMDARSALLKCSRPECPGIIRTDCLEWFTEVNRSVPSVVVSARVGTRDLINVRVTVDGKVITEALDGRAHEFDPGVHKFRLESIDRKDLKPLEQDVLISRGEQGRLLNFIFVDPNAKEKGPSGLQPTPMWRPTQPITYILMGAAGVFAVTGGVMGYLGLKERDAEREPFVNADEGGCSPFCTDDEVAPIRTKLIIADVGFGLAAASGVAALITYLARPEEPMPPEEQKRRMEEQKRLERERKRAQEAGWLQHPRVGIGPTNGGGFITFQGQF